MFAANVPEKLIRDVTGHRSRSLQLYERLTLEQRRSVSEVLLGREKRMKLTSLVDLLLPFNKLEFLCSIIFEQLMIIYVSSSL